MPSAQRLFTNELGNRIEISVSDEMPDSDAVCTACRWRGGHSPDCERRNEGWPTIRVPDDQILVQIVGPRSTSQNVLTRMEVAEMTDALTDWKHMQTHGDRS